MSESKAETVQRKCEVCGKELTKAQTRPYIIKKGRGRFCSPKCQGIWQSENLVGENALNWKGGEIKQVCEICNNSFSVKPSEVKKGWGRFCSRKCHGQWVSKNQVGANAPNWKGGGVKKECLFCAKSFLVERSVVINGGGVFCSRKCKGHWQSENLIGENNPNYTSVQRDCSWCGEHFQVNLYKIKNRYGVFCSKACRGLWQSKNLTGKDNPNWKGGKPERACVQCGKSFFATQSNIKKGWGRFCSQKCNANWQSENWTGKNSPVWKGGKSFEPYPLTFNKAFKRKIRERDGYTCAICGTSPAKSVHHINYTKDDTTPENCITLCKSCHGKTGGRRDYWQTALTELMQKRALTNYKVSFLGIELHWTEEK